MNHLQLEADLHGRGGTADVAERPPLTFGGHSKPAQILPAAKESRPRQEPLPAPDLGAPPSYLEVGLWGDRPARLGGGGRPILNPALRAGGGQVAFAHPVTGIEALFTAGPAMIDLLARIAAEPAEIDRLPGPLRERLTLLGVLVDDPAASAAKAAWERAIEQGAASFRDRQFADLKDFCSPAVLAFLRERYRRMARECGLRYGDPQVPNRRIAHNEEAAIPLHRALVPVISTLVGQPVKASYLYLGAYAEGAELHRHVDREQCEFTLSMLIDYAPDLEGPSPWPLNLYLGDETLAIHQQLGQALLFAGRYIPHSRPRLFAGHMSTSIFFHFVAENFSGRLD